MARTVRLQRHPFGTSRSNVWKKAITPAKACSTFSKVWNRPARFFQWLEKRGVQAVPAFQWLENILYCGDRARREASLSLRKTTTVLRRTVLCLNGAKLRAYRAKTGIIEHRDNEGKKGLSELLLLWFPIVLLRFLCCLCVKALWLN